MDTPNHWASRLPFYYGWLIIAVAFVTMAIAVTARTSFSLLLPPLISEFGWDRGLAAGAFSFGFLVSAVLSPVVGRIIDRKGPRLVIETGRPVAHVAAEIGVGEQVLGRWVRLQRQAADAGNTSAVLDANERAELERLRRENAELRLDREFLKKAAAFFVSENNR